MPAWRRETEALIARALGTAPTTWIDWGEALPALETARSPLVLSLVERRPRAEERSRLLGAIRNRLAAGERLVVVDHNRPRRSLPALLALVRSPWVVGTSPAARWRRLAYPTARELQAVGYDVERLLLAAGERVQIIVGRTRAE